MHKFLVRWKNLFDDDLHESYVWATSEFDAEEKFWEMHSLKLHSIRVLGVEAGC